MEDGLNWEDARWQHFQALYSAGLRDGLNVEAVGDYAATFHTLPVDDPMMPYATGFLAGLEIRHTPSQAAA